MVVLRFFLTKLIGELEMSQGEEKEVDENEDD